MTKKEMVSEIISMANILDCIKANKIYNRMMGCSKELTAKAYEAVVNGFIEPRFAIMVATGIILK